MLVCGGRDYADRERVDGVLDRLHAAYPISLIIHGRARGVDMLAQHWAISRVVKERGFQTEWDRHGRRAGFIRNRKMLEESRPDLVVGFPGDLGTRMMLDIAEVAGVFTYRVSS